MIQIIAINITNTNSDNTSKLNSLKFKTNQLFRRPSLLVGVTFLKKFQPSDTKARDLMLKTGNYCQKPAENKGTKHKNNPFSIRE